jgi:hypothetical protein
VLHYTNGTPCFPDYAACDQADEWWGEYRRVIAPTLSAAMATAGVTS